MAYQNCKWVEGGPLYYAILDHELPTVYVVQFCHWSSTNAGTVAAVVKNPGQPTTFMMDPSQLHETGQEAFAQLLAYLEDDEN